MSFHRGQEIVCIFDFWKYADKIPAQWHRNIPVQWEVYHCAGYSEPSKVDGEPMVILAEFPPLCSYSQAAFRPVQKKSMEVLRSLQAPTPVKVREDA